MKTRKEPRRLKGQGYIFKRGSKYYIEINIDGKRKKKSLHCKKLNVAKKKAKEYLRPIDAESKEEIAVYIAQAKKISSPCTIKIADVWECFSKKWKGTATGTLKNYENQWGRFEKWLKSNHPQVTELKEITESIASAYTDKLIEEDQLSTSTYNQHRGALILITNELAEKAGVEKNYWEKTSRLKDPGITRKELSEEEIKTILNSFADAKLKLPHKDEMRVLFHIGAWTGLRLADAILLKWSSIDLKQEIINCMPIKTKRHNQTVNIPIHPKLKEQFGLAAKWKTDDYVLPHLAARYIKRPDTAKSNVMKVFTSNDFKTNIQVEGRKKPTSIIGFHSLRHSFISFCAKKNVPMAVVQAIVGHSNPAITRHYIHVGKENIKQAVTALPSFSDDDVSKPKTPEERIKNTAHLITSAKIPDDLKKKLLTKLQGE